MSKIDRIIEAINNDDTMRETLTCYFQKGFSLKPTIFSKNYNSDLDWHVSYGLKEGFWSVLLMIEGVSVEAAGPNGRPYKLPLTKEQRKALDKAYWGWYQRQKDWHKFNAREAAK